MHEYSISSGIVRAVLDEAKKNNSRRVLSIQLEIGELVFHNIEQLTFWIRELFKGSVAEGAKVRVKMIEARMQCETCGYHGKGIPEGYDHFLYLAPCPECGSLQIKLLKGDECILKRIQMVR
jgi:hydrogenase nickel incorporation protein HypA/HybF